MKLIMRHFLIIYVLFSIGIAKGQHRADQQELIDPNSWSFILMGDPQGYTKYDINQPIFDLTTVWVSDHIERLKIKAVLCTGDLVETNENIAMNRNMVNQTSEEMWKSSSRSFERLDHKVPYIVSLGNHDYGYLSAENGSTNFPKYFPFERNMKWRNHLVAFYPNRDGKASMENAVFEFREQNWDPILVITSEYRPRDEMLAWCKKIIEKEQYKDHIVIFMTHSYLSGGPNVKLLEDPSKLGNSGNDLWNKFVKTTNNIKLVICGHSGNWNGAFKDNVAYVVENNDYGAPVHQMMFNVQALGGGGEGNGGDGWLRILEFMPNGKTIKVRTYSPLFGISLSTKHLAHRTEAFDQFDIDIQAN